MGNFQLVKLLGINCLLWNIDTLFYLVVYFKLDSHIQFLVEQRQDCSLTLTFCMVKRIHKLHPKKNKNIRNKLVEVNETA